MPPHIPDWEKYEQRTDTSRGELGCWLWTGKLNHDGYARAVFGKRHQMVHRWIYEQTYGPVPEGLECDHVCRNRACVNPAHINAVTHYENMQNRSMESFGKAQREKTHCPKGHPLSGDNLYVAPKRPTRRDCKACRSQSSKAQSAVRSAANALIRSTAKCHKCGAAHPKQLRPKPTCGTCQARATNRIGNITGRLV